MQFYDRKVLVSSSAASLEVLQRVETGLDFQRFNPWHVLRPTYCDMRLVAFKVLVSGWVLQNFLG